MVADRLDVVAVRIEDEGGVVVRGVLWAEAGGAVVHSSGGDGRDVERVDRGAVVALERDVRPADRPAAPDPEIESVRIRQVRERPRLFVHDAVAERLQRSQVERLRGLEVGDVDGDMRERHSGSFRSVQSPRMILDNGVVRTMDPSLPTTRALAIAGEYVAGGVGTHERALPSPEVVDLGGRCVLPGFTDSHVHFPTWSLTRREVGLEGVSTLDEAVERVRSHPRHGTWIRGYGWRSAEWDEQPTAKCTRRGDGRNTRAPLLEGLPLRLAQLGGARPGRRRPRSGRRRRRARRVRFADRNHPGGVRMAVPRSGRDADRGRVRRRDARGAAHRRRAAASSRSTTRTAGWEPLGSSSGSRRATASPSASGSPSPTNGFPSSRRSGSTPGSATTSCGSVTSRRSWTGRSARRRHGCSTAPA